MKLTEAERRALDAGRVTVVRPMEDQGYETVSRSASNITGLWSGTIEKDGRTGFMTFEAPVTPGDTLPDYPGSLVVGVEAMRLETSMVVLALRGEGRLPIRDLDHGKLILEWNETYGHRPDWRYEANPRCWVVEVERLRGEKGRLLTAVMDAYHEGWNDGLDALNSESAGPTRREEVEGWMFSNVRKSIKDLTHQPERKQSESATRKEEEDNISLWDRLDDFTVPMKAQDADDVLKHAGDGDDD